MAEDEPILQNFSEMFMETEAIHFQIMRFGEATYVWIGHNEARQDTLAYGIPSALGKPGQPTTAGTLLGGQGGDSASETMAKRLAQRLKHPVFVSISLKEEPDLRAWAERKALAALLKSQGNGAAMDVSDKSTAGIASSVPPSIASVAAPRAGTTTELGSSSESGDVGIGARTYEVFENSDTLGTAASALLISAAQAAIAARGQFVVALSGGSIPKLLAPTLLARKTDACFESWQVFLADERYVALDHPDSNLGEWQARMLTEAGVPPGQIYSLNVSIPLATAAAEYEAHLRGVAGGGRASEGGMPPVIDAVVLGMGPDGHTASLFPEHGLLAEEGCWVATISDSPKPPPERITLTIPCLNAAKLCLFVVTGGSKAPCVRRAFSPEPDVPAGLILATHRTHWLLDTPAAVELLEEVEKQSAMYS